MDILGQAEWCSFDLVDQARILEKHLLVYSAFIIESRLMGLWLAVRSAAQMFIRHIK